MIISFKKYSFTEYADGPRAGLAGTRLSLSGRLLAKSGQVPSLPHPGPCFLSREAAPSSAPDHNGEGRGRLTPQVFQNFDKTCRIHHTVQKGKTMCNFCCAIHLFFR